MTIRQSLNGVAYKTEVEGWFYLEAVDVLAQPSVKGAIVTLGDSITDGHSSTLNANHRWPDYLAERIQRQGKGRQYSVLNSGISGNKILRDSPVYGVNALARLDGDLLTNRAQLTSFFWRASTILGTNRIHSTQTRSSPE